MAIPDRVVLWGWGAALWIKAAGGSSLLFCYDFEQQRVGVAAIVTRVSVFVVRSVVQSACASTSRGRVAQVERREVRAKQVRFSITS